MAVPAHGRGPCFRSGRRRPQLHALRGVADRGKRRPTPPPRPRTGCLLMATTAERMRAHSGPAILSYGFRPFFLLAAIWAAAVVAIWLPMLGGALALPTAFSPLEWHVHELVYGYVPSIVAGFALTAVPNWTGRLPVTGAPLLDLVATWVAGRLGVATLARIGWPVAGTDRV